MGLLVGRFRRDSQADSGFSDDCSVSWTWRSVRLSAVCDGCVGHGGDQALRSATGWETPT